MKKAIGWIGIILFVILIIDIAREQLPEEEKEMAFPTINMESASLLSPHRILNIAHRGASGHAPEHTLVAYEMAAEIGTDYLEIDLQMTKDGELVAMHDADIARTTNGTGLVSDYTLRELQKLDAGSWFNQKYPLKANPDYKGIKVPTLDEILEHFGSGSNYYIEIKQPNQSPNMISKLITTLEEYELIGKNSRDGAVIIQSFSEESLKQIHKLNPSIPLIQLKGEPTSNRELAKIREYAIGVGVKADAIDGKFTKKVRNADLLLHAYTVNEKNEMRQLVKLGVTGMFTNYPDLLQDVLIDLENSSL